MVSTQNPALPIKGVTPAKGFMHGSKSFRKDSDLEVTVQCKDGTRKSIMPMSLMHAPPRKSKLVEAGSLEGLGLRPSVLQHTDECDHFYHEVLAHADSKAFPEEWDAQLIMDCGPSEQGRLMVFTPAFLKFYLEDDYEMDQAFKYVIHRLDPIATKMKYSLVWCCVGLDMTKAKVTERLRLATHLLPKSFMTNLRKLYVLHATAGVRVMMWTMWPWIQQSVWDCLTYTSSIAKLLEEVQTDPARRQEMRRRFPLMVQREDARRQGEDLPPTFGAAASEITASYGIDYQDKTTGRCYSRLPPAVIFICEMLERQAGHDAFPSMFNSGAAQIYEQVATVDEGEPIDPDTPLPLLWCMLKLFLDCMPEPLLSFHAFEALAERNITKEDVVGQFQLLRDLLSGNIIKDSTDMMLYLASFLHTMCQKPLRSSRLVDSDSDSEETESTQDSSDDEEQPSFLTPDLAGEVFAAAFIRPRMMSAAGLKLLPVAQATVSTLIRHAEDQSLRDASKLAKAARTEAS